jgi:hypothetical protein
MKRFFLMLMLCISVNFVYAQEKPIYEVPCKVVKPSPFFDRDTSDFPYKGELQPGGIIAVAGVALFVVKRRK